MISRYTRPEMAEIWTDDKKYDCWLAVELAADEAWSKLGHIPAEDVEAVDTTGAGDVFSAVMSYVYLQNGNIVSAVKYATCAAALSVMKAGAYTSIPTRKDVLSYIREKKTPV